jgi:membrane protease YdiL (CAAX protease family)
MAARRDGYPFGGPVEGQSPLEGAPGGSAERARPLAAAIGIYGFVAAFAVAASTALGQSPIECHGWLGAEGAASWLLSLGAAVPLGVTTIAATRIVVRRAPWAGALHAALRPAVHRASDGSLFVLALASATGEELLFRGLLVPLVGVFASSLVFGALHQVRGRARWAWMAWATLMGALFATIFAATGSLIGPFVAHAAINHANLRFLRDNDPSPRRRRRLGGLLER